MKKALVCGAGGFIGSHLVSRLSREGCTVTGVDLSTPMFSVSDATDFIQGDLRDRSFVEEVLYEPADEVYQLAADMGGAGYLFTGDNDADVMHNSALINLNVLQRSAEVGVGKIFFSSSACVYPQRNQRDPDNPSCREDSVMPADPDSEYGWEKLFSERLYQTFQRNYGLEARIGRLHNVFGPIGTWQGGREKVPAAICRKVAEVHDGDSIEVWGDGKQTRSFLYIEECLEAITRLMASNCREPLNIGSEEMVSINSLVEQIANIAGKTVQIRHVQGPEGVRGRTSDNRLIHDMLGWQPTRSLQSGLVPTYAWIADQVAAATS